MAKKAGSRVRKTQTGKEGALPPDLRLAREDFLQAMRVEAGLARRTLEAYGRDLDRSLTWFAKQGLRRLVEIHQDHVVSYLRQRRAQGMAESTLARELVSLRMLLRFAQAEGSIPQSPIHLMPIPKRSALLPSYLSPEDVESLLLAPKSSAWRDQRDRALLEVLYASGARVSEALGLTTDSLHAEMRSVRLHGKGDKMRLVPLGAKAQLALRTWLENGRKHLLKGRPSSIIFLGPRLTALTRGSAWRIVRTRAAQAGIQKPISPTPCATPLPPT